jgi:hypothetical protein
MHHNRVASVLLLVLFLLFLVLLLTFVELLELLLRVVGRPEAVIAVIADIGINGAITPTSVKISSVLISTGASISRVVVRLLSMSVTSLSCLV